MNHYLFKGSDPFKSDTKFHLDDVVDKQLVDGITVIDNSNGFFAFINIDTKFDSVKIICFKTNAQDGTIQRQLATWIKQKIHNYMKIDEYKEVDLRDMISKIDIPNDKDNFTNSIIHMNGPIISNHIIHDEVSYRFETNCNLRSVSPLDWKENLKNWINDDQKIKHWLANRKNLNHYHEFRTNITRDYPTTFTFPTSFKRCYYSNLKTFVKYADYDKFIDHVDQIGYNDIKHSIEVYDLFYKLPNKKSFNWRGLSMTPVASGKHRHVFMILGNGQKIDSSQFYRFESLIKMVDCYDKLELEVEKLRLTVG